MISIQRIFQVLLAALLPFAGVSQAGEPVSLTHVHGLAYTPDASS